jgi:hypothetical protein
VNRSVVEAYIDFLLNSLEKFDSVYTDFHEEPKELTDQNISKDVEI